MPSTHIGQGLPSKSIDNIICFPIRILLMMDLSLTEPRSLKSDA